jgi:hypothetical protein
MLTKRAGNFLKKELHLLPGDSLQLWEVRGEQRTLLHTEPIARTMDVNYVMTFDVVNELGMSEGIGCAFGKKQEATEGVTEA